MRLITCTSICSLDDEAFMRATNVPNDDYFSQDYASQEYDTQDDNLNMDEEGFIMKERTRNYTIAEDVFICIAWKKVSLDASVGTELDANTYWQHIKEYFNERNTSGHYQSRDSIHQRCGCTVAVQQPRGRRPVLHLHFASSIGVALLHLQYTSSVGVASFLEM